MKVDLRRPSGSSAEISAPLSHIGSPPLMSVGTFSHGGSGQSRSEEEEEEGEEEGEGGGLRGYLRRGQATPKLYPPHSHSFIH